MTLDRIDGEEASGEATDTVGTSLALVRVAIISDTHGHLDARIAALIESCDYAVHAGDIVDGDVLEAMRPRRHKVCVAGNNDVPARWAQHQAGICAALPRVAQLSLPGGVLVAEHGDRFGDTPPHERLRAAYPKARAIVYGHTHRLVCDTDTQPWVLNPGASGRIRNRGGASCLILTAGRESWSVQPHKFSD